MKKKVEKFMQDIKKGCWYDCCEYGNKSFVARNGNGVSIMTNGCRGVITTEDLSGIVDESTKTLPYGGVMREVTEWPERDLHGFELPEKETMKAGIRETSEGKRKLVSWCKGEGYPRFSARFVLDAMEALNARWLYYDPKNYRKGVMYMFENDDFEAKTVAFLLPVISWNGDGYGFNLQR